MSNKPDPLIGTTVAGRYRIVQPLGKGGMGVVYLAVHDAIEKKVALKVLRREYSTKPDIVSRFQQEAISASRIKHPNVLDVFDFGQLNDGAFFLAMEYLDGRDLAQELKQLKVIQPERGVGIALQICSALAAAHARGVVHRDLKPENVFLQRSSDGGEHVKIVDFGIAQLRTTEETAEHETEPRRLTRTGMIFGTPEYMAPEQAEGRDADLRADVYALGVILYEMFTGAVPFTGETFLGVLTSHLHKPVPPLREICPELAISTEVEQVILQALEKQPASRQQSMSELANQLLSSPEATRLAIPMRQPSIPEVTPGEFVPQSEHIPLPLVRGTSAAQTGSLDEGRADTQLEAETQPEKPRRSRWGWVVVTLLVLLAGSGGAIYHYRPALLTSVLAVGPTAEPVAPPRPEPPAPAAPPAEPEPVAPVRLHVVTEPSEAVVFKDGFQVCDSTPCDVRATADETLIIEARKDQLRGSAKVLAQRDQRVRIVLEGEPEPKPKPVVRPRPAPRPKPPPPPPPKPAMCEVEVDGLKILRPCQ